MSRKIRVHELSKELGIQSKDLIRILNELGAGVKNHMSTVDEQYLEQVRRSFNTGVKKEGKPAPEAKAVPRRKEDASPTQDAEKAKAKAKVTTSSGKKESKAAGATKTKPAKEAAVPPKSRNRQLPPVRNRRDRLKRKAERNRCRR